MSGKYFKEQLKTKNIIIWNINIDSKYYFIFLISQKNIKNI